MSNEILPVAEAAALSTPSQDSDPRSPAPDGAAQGEDNWSRCLRLAREIDKGELIQCLLLKIAEMRKPRERSIPLWSFVGDATSHGSGVSCAICAVYGVDSDTGRKAG